MLPSNSLEMFLTAVTTRIIVMVTGIKMGTTLLAYSSSENSDPPPPSAGVFVGSPAGRGLMVSELGPGECSFSSE